MNIVIWTESTGHKRATVTKNDEELSSLKRLLKKHDIVPVVEPHSYRRVVQLFY